MLIIALILNIILIGLELMVLISIKGKRNILKYYTYLQNFLSLITSIIFSLCLIFCLSSKKSIPEFIKGLRYVSTCGLLATSFIFLIFLRKENKNVITQDDLLFNFNPKLANIILHYLSPLLSLVSLVFFEQVIILTNGIWPALVAIPSCLYWLVYLILSASKKWDEPYEFSTKNKFIEVLTFILIPISFIVISIILWNII